MTRHPVADAIRELTSGFQTDQLAVGTVTSTNPLEVTLGGGTSLSASRLSTYTRNPGDRVLILQTETELVVLGKLVNDG